MRTLLAALLATVGVVACSEDGAGGDEAPAGGQGGTAGETSAAGTGGASAGAGGGVNDAGADAGLGEGDDTDDAGLGDAGAPALVGVCGQRGESTVNASAFEGFEEFYLISDEGFGDDICVVRFDVARVGDAPEGCDDPTADVDCLWTHLVELSNPSVVTDVDGACAGSELGLDADAIAELDGSRAAYGFVSEFAGHNSVLLKYDEGLAEWDAYGNGTWDEAAEAFRFDRRDGFCNY